LLAAAKTKNGVVLRYGAASGAMRITPETKKEFMRLIDEALQSCVAGSDSAAPGAELLKDYVFPPVTGAASGPSAGVPTMMPAHNIRLVRFNFVTDDVERRHLIEAKRTDDEQKRRVKDEKRQKKKEDVKPNMPNVNARNLIAPHVMPPHRGTMGAMMDVDEGKDDKDHDHLTGVKRQRLSDGQQHTGTASAAATAAVAAAVAAAAAAAQRTPDMGMDDGRPNTRKRRGENE